MAAGEYSGGYVPVDSCDAGVRFRNISIPQGSTIVSATLSVYVSSELGVNPSIIIAGDDQDDADTWSSGEVGGHTQTTATVTKSSWSVNWNDIDVTAIVQEIIDRAGWVSGNAMRFSLRDNGNSEDIIFMHTREQSGSNQADLSIEYEEPAGGSAILFF